MYRRTFFKSLLGVAALPLAGRQVEARTTPQRWHIQTSPLAGFQYHAGEKLWRRLRVGQTLALAREPDNPHDARAVRIDWHGRKLGYLPRVENTAVSQMLDRNGRLTARIAALDESYDPWQRVELEVWLEVMS